MRVLIDKLQKIKAVQYGEKLDDFSVKTILAYVCCYADLWTRMIPNTQLSCNSSRVKEAPSSRASCVANSRRTNKRRWVRQQASTILFDLVTIFHIYSITHNDTIVCYKRSSLLRFIIGINMGNSRSEVDLAIQLDK